MRNSIVLTVACLLAGSSLQAAELTRQGAAAITAPDARERTGCCGVALVNGFLCEHDLHSTAFLAGYSISESHPDFARESHAPSDPPAGAGRSGLAAGGRVVP